MDNAQNKQLKTLKEDIYLPLSYPTTYKFKTSSLVRLSLERAAGVGRAALRSFLPEALTTEALEEQSPASIFHCLVTPGSKEEM
eukprot:m.310409 g.310409  ORF g.310409 m.310409 type:complete len:84 (+) comp51453_c0_seq1:2076-2327(+)